MEQTADALRQGAVLAYPVVQVMSALEIEAREFATFHHGRIHHRRKYNFRPYISHPEAVANLVRTVDNSPVVLAACWLHDTVEDTAATLDDIMERFGLEVASLVEMVTDVSQPEDGNRAARKALDREHLAKASPDAKTIKLGDLIINGEDIFLSDPKFARVFLPEKAQLLQVLREGNPILWRRALDVLTKAAPDVAFEYQLLERPTADVLEPRF